MSHDSVLVLNHPWLSNYRYILIILTRATRVRLRSTAVSVLTPETAFGKIKFYSP